MINIKEVSQKDLVRADEISTARGICNLYSCYKKKHLFSANQKCVIFSCSLLLEVLWQAVRRFTYEILGVKGLLQLGSFIIMINL